jgi:hypothetical protein
LTEIIEGERDKAARGRADALAGAPSQAPDVCEISAELVAAGHLTCSSTMAA